MPWELEISTIDVGQGESSLLIARDTGPGGQVRTMLIDGGLAGYAPIVHAYVSARLGAFGIPRLHHLLVSHYDVDHTGGVMTLLASDNLDAICDVIAQAAAAAIVAAIANARDAAHQVAAAAAAAAAACTGGYDQVGGGAHAVLAVNAGAAAEVMPLPGGRTPAEHAAAGAALGRAQADGAPLANPRLFRSPQSVTAAATAAALGTAGAAGGAPARAAVAQPLVFARVQGAIYAPVRTGGLYRTTHVIDIGDTDHVPDGYVAGVVGAVTIRGDYAVVAPGVARQRTSLDRARLGREILWNTGPAAVAAPANSPAGFLVACRKYVWQAPPMSCPIASGQPDNDDGIALVIRFGNFFFYTGGDLPTAGEDLVATAVMANGFTDPQGGGAFPAPQRIAAFKCGHHGSNHSTSAPFLQACSPRAAFVSCGRRVFGTGDTHPTQAAVDRLNAGVSLFFLTNCKYVTNYVPGSSGSDQLTVIGNRSRLCGDNADNNVAALRARGTSRLYLSQAEATAGDGGRQFHVEYFDNDDLPGWLGPPPAPVIGPRTENQAY